MLVAAGDKGVMVRHFKGLDVFPPVGKPHSSGDTGGKAVGWKGASSRGNEAMPFLSFTFSPKKASLRHSALNTKWLGVTHCIYIASLSDAFYITNGVVH